MNTSLRILAPLFLTAIACDSDSDASSDDDAAGVSGGKADDLDDAKACSYDIMPSFGAEFSNELVDGLGIGPAQIERDGLSALQIEQLGATALHLEFLVPGQESDLDALFAVPDEGEYFYASGVIDGVAIDWVQFYAGDNEVGVVFDQGTNRIIAEISDAEILGCTAG